MPICFDLQLEAEILGCELQWAKDAPPSVISHPLADTDEIPNTTISKNDGRLPLVFDVTKRIKEKVGDEIAIYGLFCGPFTLASHLRGSKIFMNMLKNPDYMNKLMAYCTEIALTMVDFIEAGVDVVHLDPLISQISPKHFNAYSENYKKIFKRIRRKEHFPHSLYAGMPSRA